MPAWRQVRRGTTQRRKLGATFVVLAAYLAGLLWVVRDKGPADETVELRVVSPATGAILAPGDTILIDGLLLGESAGAKVICNGHRTSVAADRSFRVKINAPQDVGVFFVECIATMPGGGRGEGEFAYFVLEPEQTAVDAPTEMFVRIPLSFLTQSVPGLPGGVLTLIEGKTRSALNTLVTNVAARIRLPLVGEIVGLTGIDVGDVDAQLTLQEFGRLDLALRINRLQISAKVSLDQAFVSDSSSSESPTDTGGGRLARIRRGLARRAKSAARAAVEAVPDELRPRIPVTMTTQVEAHIPLLVEPGDLSLIAVGMAGEPKIEIGQLDVDFVGMAFEVTQLPQATQVIQAAMTVLLKDQISMVVESAADTLLSRLQLPAELHFGRQNSRQGEDLHSSLRLDALTLHKDAIWCRLLADSAGPADHDVSPGPAGWRPPDHLLDVRGNRLSVMVPVSTVNQYLRRLWRGGGLEDLEFDGGFPGIRKTWLSCMGSPVLHIGSDDQVSTYFPWLSLKFGRGDGNQYHFDLGAVASVELVVDRTEDSLGFVFALDDGSAFAHPQTVDLSGRLLQTWMSHGVFSACLRALKLHRRRWTMFLHFPALTWLWGSSSSRLSPLSMAAAGVQKDRWLQIEFHVLDDGGN